jgi:hypothetical protein
VLHEFLASNRDELVRRCRAKGSERNSPPLTPAGLDLGAPLVLEQLGWALRGAEESPALQGHQMRGGSGKTPAALEITRTAVLHGKELVEQGYTVGQVVHDYGDIGQAITELAMERNSPLSVDESDTLNRFLDSAIADAVGAYEVSRDPAPSTQREQRKLLDTATQAFAALKVGDIGLEGAAGQLLEDSLRRLRDLVDRPPA